MDTEREFSFNLEGIDPDPSLKFLVQGYLDYSYDVIKSRALPAIDGFKPSQRRIMYTLLKGKAGLMKSSNLVGDVMKIHPHGESSIYGALCNMVDTRESMSVPYITGKGAFGKVYSVDPPAATRYTEVKLADIMSEFKEDLAYVRHTPTYDYKYKEPALLPSPFPNILTNPQRGIAVGLSTNIPSFNYHEVIKGAIEVIKTGSLKKPLVPDFATGGNIYINEKQLEKLSKKGSGRVYLRGDYHIEGNTLVISSLPYYTTTEEFLKQVEELASEVTDIKDYRDEFGREGFRIAIECKKGTVDSVFKRIISSTKLQMSLNVNLNLLIDETPVRAGVEEILQEWVKFRKSILNAKYPVLIEGVTNRIEELETLISLIEDKEKLGMFFDKLKKNEVDALNFLKERFPKVPIEVLEKIMNMRIKQFANVELRLKDLKIAKDEKKLLEDELADLDNTIIKQLKELDKKYKFPRKTKITEDWLVYEKPKVIPVIKNTRVFLDGKFLHYQEDFTTNKGIECTSQDVLTITDSLGRILRVDLSTIDFTNRANSATGIYLTSLLGLDNDDYEIVSYNIIRQDTNDIYLYDDCYISKVNYSEWVGANKMVRVLQNGVAMPWGSRIIAKLSDEKPYNLLIAKGKKGLLIGLVDMTKVSYKNRLARVKALNVPEDYEVIGVLNLNLTEILSVYPGAMNHTNSLKYAKGLNTEKLKEFLKGS